MKTYLNTKFNRPHLAVNMGLYSHVFAVMLVILSAALSALWVYHIPSFTSATTLNATPSPWVISIEREGEYYVKQGKKATRVISLDSLKNMIKSDISILQKTQRSIWLKVNSQVQYGHVKQVILLLQALGIQQVGLVTAGELG